MTKRFDGKPTQDDNGPKQALYEHCDYCRQQKRYYRKSEPHGGVDRIIGRSTMGGYICLACYESRPVPEQDWYDQRIAKLRASDTPVGAMIRAAEGPQTKEQRHELIQWMKSVVRDFGKLPYDKNVRVGESDREI